MAQNDIYRYNPQEHHCNEGIAVENDRGVLVDTFWGLGDSMGHVVGRNQHLEHLGNLDDYERLGQNPDHAFEDYAPADRLAVPSQHGLQRAPFVRTGAQPDLATKIENARRSLAEAESALRSAEHRVEWARKDLAELEAERDA